MTKLSKEQTDQLCNDLLSAGSEFGAGQALVKRYLDEEMATRLHEGHSLIVSGVDALRDGKHIEAGIGLTQKGHDTLSGAYKSVQEAVFANDNRINADTKGLALMGDGLNWLSEIIKPFEPEPEKAEMA